MKLAPMDAVGSPITRPMVDEERIEIARQARLRKEETIAENLRIRQETLAAAEAERLKWMQEKENEQIDRV